MAQLARVTYNGLALEDGGIAVVAGNNNFDFFSPISLITEGFLYGFGDIWFNQDPGRIQNVSWTDQDALRIQNVVWLDCSCEGMCA